MRAMNRRDFGSLLLASVAGRGLMREAVDIPVLLSANSTLLENFAALELSRHLHSLFPGCGFSVSQATPQGRSFIWLGSLENSPQLRQFVSGADLAKPESYIVTTAQEGEASSAIVAGADPRGTLFAVYALLEKLGFGFYLSYDAQPDPQTGPFAFAGWRLADAPLLPERILFNWHNFLSGCSGWDLSDWQGWITQAAKMRFNSIMVHAYGNNPMFSFTHNGQTKPTGFLTSSARGRDWGNEHVNDVRRIAGGEGVFEGPVLGSRASRAPKEQTVEAATDLMKLVFAFARSRGLGVNFALDVDTYSANPQNVIATLPESARFTSGKYLLPNPDTGEGSAYYESQVRQLLGNYPEIGRIVLWFREVGSPWSPWRDLPVSNFPPPWKTEYQKALAKDPSLANDRQSPGLFAIHKIARAFRASLDKMGKSQVKLALGSWEFDYLRAADAFMSPEIETICIDQWDAFGKQEIQAAIRAVSSRRKVIAIPYAQDDDGHYAGRPYTPPAAFASWLLQCGCAGFGILHWTTRPLDLYLKSLSLQVWKSSRDQPLVETCESMAERTFGKGARATGGKYLARWITEAPMFGRETTDRFMDRPLAHPEDVITRGGQRLKMLQAMAASPLSAQAAKWLAYFQDWESFVANFYRNHSAFERAVKFWKSGDLAQAREHLAQSRPEQVLQRFARTATRAGITAGEKGLLVSMNLRWLPYIVSQRQALGMESVRWRFEATEDEPLAQQPGIYTFFLDRERHLWRAWGEKETGLPAVAQSEAPEEMRESYLELDKILSLRLRCIMGEPLRQGNYGVKLLFLAPIPPQSSIDLELRGSAHTEPVSNHIDFQEKPRDSSGVIPMSYSLHIDQGFLGVDIKPQSGKALLCGVVLQPAPEKI